MLQDRELIERAQDAFVSYLRYYKEHQLSFIFSVALLDVGHVANAFCLFRLPRVKEILGRRVENFVSQKSVAQLESVPFVDLNKGK